MKKAGSKMLHQINLLLVALVLVSAISCATGSEESSAKITCANTICVAGSTCDDSTGIPRCVKNSAKITCANTICAAGSTCDDSTGVPRCLKNKLTCASTLCLAGTTCKDIGGVPRCIPNVVVRVPRATCANVRCAEGPCKMINGRPRCPIERAEEECQTICTAVFDPVCGTDGITYGNECELQADACMYDTPVVVAYEGQCRCKRGCPKIHLPVCGTDGKTYNNECLLNNAACRNSSLKVAYEGRCDN